MNEAPFTVVEIVQGDRSQAESRIEELFALGVLQPGPKYDIYHSPSVIRQIILQKV